MADTYLNKSGLTYYHLKIVGLINTLLANKINISAIANDLTTTTTGSVLDATQGKALKDLVDGLTVAAVKNITRSGTTFTVTRVDDTTFTFDQQDTTYSAVTASSDGLMTSTMYSDAISPLATAVTQAEVNALFT